MQREAKAGDKRNSAMGSETQRPGLPLAVLVAPSAEHLGVGIPSVVTGGTWVRQP